MFLGATMRPSRAPAQDPAERLPEQVLPQSLVNSQLPALAGHPRVPMHSGVGVEVRPVPAVSGDSSGP